MKKMNQRGFTVVELLTSFSLATVVMVFLFNILISIKESYIGHKAVSEANTNQAFISRIINDDAVNYVLTSKPVKTGNVITLNVDCVTNLCGTEKKIQYDFSNGTIVKKIDNNPVDAYTWSNDTTVTISEPTSLKEFGEKKYYMLNFSFQNSYKNYSIRVYFPAK